MKQSVQVQCISVVPSRRRDDGRENSKYARARRLFYGHDETLQANIYFDRTFKCFYVYAGFWYWLNVAYINIYKYTIYRDDGVGI